MSTPAIVRENGHPRLYVDGRPWLILGAQWDYRNVHARANRDALFARARKLNCNTTFIPVFWGQVEPDYDRYDLEAVDEILAGARRSGLRLVLLWFGSNREGRCFYRQPRGDGGDEWSAPLRQVPSYLLSDPHTYRHAVLTDGEPHPLALCPLCSETRIREAKAFRAFMTHLSEADGQGTVIMIQVNNEISAPPVVGGEQALRFMAGCYCPACRGEWANGAYPSFNALMAASYARYTEALAAAGSEVHPLPMYVNFVASLRPGEDVRIFLDEAPHLFAVGPDAYGRDTEEFRQILRRYQVGRNVPFVPETASDEHTPTEENLLVGLGEFGIIGMDLWAVDCPCGYWTWQPEPRPRASAPLFLEDGTFAGRAPAIAEVFGLVQRTAAIIAPRLGTEDLLCFVGEGKGGRITCTWPEGGLRVDYPASGRGLVVRVGPGDYTVLGRECTVTLAAPAARAESGSWTEAGWRPDRSIALEAAERESVLRLDEADVIRVIREN